MLSLIDFNFISYLQPLSRNVQFFKYGVSDQIWQDLSTNMSRELVPFYICSTHHGRRVLKVNASSFNVVLALPNPKIYKRIAH